MPEKPASTYSLPEENEIKTLINQHSNYFESNKDTFSYNSIATMKLKFLSIFEKTQARVFKFESNPPGMDQQVEEKVNVLMLSMAPYMDHYSNNNEEGRSKFRRDAPCIHYSEDHADKVRQMLSSDLHDKFWYTSYFPRPITKDLTLEREYYFFSYYFYLMLIIRKPAVIMVTNGYLFDRLVQKNTWESHCNLTIASKITNEKKKYHEITLTDFDHTIKLFKIDHPISLQKNPNRIPYNQETMDSVIGKKKKKVFSTTNVFEHMNTQQAKLQQQQKETNALKEKRGSELNKKEQIKSENRRKRDEEKMRIAEKVNRSHKSVYTEKNKDPTPIKKGKMEKD